MPKLSNRMVPGVLDIGRKGSPQETGAATNQCPGGRIARSCADKGATGGADGSPGQRPFCTYFE